MSSDAATASPFSFLEEGYEGKKYILTCKIDGAKFLISEKMAMKIGTVWNYLGAGDRGDDEILEFPCERVENGAILKRILDFVKHYENEPEQEPEVSRSQKIKPMDDWDYSYIGNSLSEIFHILIAADYLNIPSLKMVCSRRSADYFNTCTPAEIREKFNLPDDLSKKEKESIENEKKAFSKMTELKRAP